MVNEDIVVAKLGELADRLGQIRIHRKASAEELGTDRAARDLVSFNLMLAVQACTDVAGHIIADAQTEDITLIERACSSGPAGPLRPMSFAQGSDPRACSEDENRQAFRPTSARVRHDRVTHRLRCSAPVREKSLSRRDEAPRRRPPLRARRLQRVFVSPTQGSKEVEHEHHVQRSELWGAARG